MSEFISSAEAAKLNLERGKTDPKSVLAGQLAAIEAVEAPSEDTLVIHLNQPAASLLGAFAGAAGMMGSPTAWADASYATHPVGTGPWAVSDDSQPGSEMVYAAFADYWDKDVQKVDEVRIRMGAESTFVPALKGGEAQAVLLTGAPDDAKTLADGGLDVNESGISYMRLLYLNKTGIFQDERVRQAVSYAIDRESICTALLAGSCTVTGQPVRPTSWAYDSELDAPEYDPDKARELLADAGYPDGFSFTALVASSATQFQTELTAIQTALADVGITLTISAQPVAQLVPTYTAGTAEAYYTVNVGGADPAIPLAAMTNPPFNPGGYVDEDISSALAAAQSAETLQDRAAALQSASAAYAESSFNVVMFNQDLFFATSGLTGVTAKDPLVLDPRGVARQ